MQIVCENLHKHYQIAERAPGLRGALTGVFHRTYRTKAALDGVCFEIEKGELVGYIGPNGAGKSTTVKVLSGILVPDSGRCDIGGLTPWKSREQHVRRIGVVFGQRTQLWWDLPAGDSFDLLKAIYRIPAEEYERSLDELVTMLDLAPLFDTPVRQLSLGQRMRCDIAASLLHNPEILFLDEPTIGLDATSKLAVREFVKMLNKQRKVTVILTTHDMDDIEALCSRVMVIGSGKILSDGSLEQLRSRVSSERWLILDLDEDPLPESCDDYSVMETVGRRVSLCYDPIRVPTAKLIAQITSQYSVRDLLVQNPPIEQIIARLYQDQLS